MSDRDNELIEHILLIKEHADGRRWTLTATSTPTRRDLALCSNVN
ncbi:MAG: hypothetical protein OXC00_06655 [Acidimicrobiaceae bacterium]|nr:hypothetical protein [Acidimicrobiaceae bacterium]